MLLLPFFKKILLLLENEYSQDKNNKTIVKKKIETSIHIKEPIVPNDNDSSIDKTFFLGKKSVTFAPKLKIKLAYSNK